MNLQSRLLLALVPALFVGCGSFQKKWDAVGQAGRFQHATRWDGRWTSERHVRASGAAEGGRLRCVTEPRADGKVVAHFHANWQMFAAGYEMTLEPKPGAKRGGALEFRGTHPLSRIFGGTYRYDARIAGDRFTARYDSSYDSGTFAMTRQLTNSARFH